MKIIDYVLSSTTVSNPDTSMPAVVSNCTVVSGPGVIVSGKFPKALDLGTNGHLRVELTPNSIETGKFCLRVVFKTVVAINARQNLVESNCLPFSMFIDKADGGNDFKVVVSVNPKNHGWGGTTTEFFKDLKLDTWYTADLVYDIDTVAVFIDGIILSVHAFPFGTIEKFPGNHLFIGTWVDGARNQFNGHIAAVEWHNDSIPEELEKQLDERRSHPEWFITYKQESIKNRLNIGFPIGKYVYDSSVMAYVQLFDAGLISYNESIGAAFEMHGSIFQYYKTIANKSELGYPVSDEINTTKAGGRKSIFSKGGIYWSAATGAFPVTGQLYLDYEQLGESAYIGMPVAAANNINNGREQLFEKARMYFKNGSPKAFEVHGAILEKFLTTGGVNTWGYPVTNELDVKNGSSSMGKFSDFENCTIYWSSSTGAFEVHGDIRLKYRDLKGPIGQLGFPTSDEGNIPGSSGGSKFNTFQNGSILWFGGWNNMFVCQSFKFFLGRIDTKESEGFAMGQNDVYLMATLSENGTPLWSQRFPNSGDSNGQNVFDVNTLLGATIVPNNPNRIIRFTVDVWESDGGAPFGRGDDHLGTYIKDLNMANAWGMAENNGIFNTGSFQNINAITWSVKPQINEDLLTTSQRWWGVRNTATAKISLQQYASAFKDVDSDSEWWDLTDWLEKAFYELVIRGLAGGGNCFGMSLEAINSIKHRSIFSLPLDRFTNWNNVVNEFNIKHQYQVGASAIWWFVDQVLSGNTHDPVDVFNRTRNEFNRGCHPVVCLSQNWDFSGKPHCVLPIGWDSSTKPWKMTICDPNFPSNPNNSADNFTRTLFIDPDKNVFNYDGGNKYEGAEWSGGRFYYMPYSVTNERPYTPIGDAILLLLRGTIIIMGSDSETIALVDDNGVDLDAYGPDSIKRLKENNSISNKFVSVKGFDAKSVPLGIDHPIIHTPLFIKAKGIIPSELFMRNEKLNTRFEYIQPELAERPALGNFSLTDMINDKTTAAIINQLGSNSTFFNNIKDRNLSYIINDKNLMATLNPALGVALIDLVSTSAIGKNFKHKIRGVSNGQLMYAIKNKLNEFSIQSSIKNSESCSIETKDIGSASSIIKMICTENKTIKLEITNKLGVGKDNLKIVIDKIPVAVGKDLSFNIKPGLAGLDILTTSEKVNATVAVQGTLDGKNYSKNFNVDIEGGIRLRPSTVFTNNELKIGKIDTLFGQLRKPMLIKGF